MDYKSLSDKELQNLYSQVGDAILAHEAAQEEGISWQEGQAHHDQLTGLYPQMEAICIELDWRRAQRAAKQATEKWLADYPADGLPVNGSDLPDNPARHGGVL